MGDNLQNSSFLGPSLKEMLRLLSASNLSDVIHAMLICIVLDQALPLDYEDSNSSPEVGT